MFKKYKEVILYLVFGVLTTLVNWLSYMVLTDLFHVPYLWATVVSQVLAVLFAYVTNRKWVFESKARGTAAVAREMGKFFGCRAMAFVLDVALMWIGVDLLHVNDKAMKLVANVVIVIVNYVSSKLVVFKKTR